MMSKNLFFKRMKEDLEQRIWLPVIYFILLFLAMEMPLISRLDRWDGLLSRIIRYLTEDFFTVNSILTIITMGVAVVAALSGFGYMHSAKKLDVYHSIPIKREHLFIKQYCYGVLYFMIPLFCHVLLCLGLSVVNGVGISIILGRACEFVLAQLLIYLVTYSTAISAVCLTGNLVISVLGCAVLLGYSSVLELIKEGLMDTFLETYYANENSCKIWAFSPAHLVFNMADTGETSGYAGFYVKLVFMLFVYSLLAIFSYKKRPTEAAGKTMVYGVTEPVVKTMVVFPSSIAFGYLFASILMSGSDNFVWFVTGCVFGFLLCSVVMEVIYRRDVKSAFMQPLQIAANGALVLAVVFSFRLDVLGYDSYVPKENEVESYSLYVPALNVGFDEGNVRDYCLQSMRMTENEGVRNLLEYAAAYTRPARRQETNTRVSDDCENLYFTAAYHLQNGETVYRRYWANTKETQVQQWIREMYDDPAYKQGAYPIMAEEDYSEYVGILLEYAYYSESIQLSAEDMERFIKTYQQELAAQKFEELEDTDPVVKLSFAKKYTNQETERTTVKEIPEVYGEGVSFEYDMELYGYMIYPSFHNTLALLEAFGAEIVNEIPAEDVTGIRIMLYDGAAYELVVSEKAEIETEHVYTAQDLKKEQIAQLLENVLPLKMVRGVITNRMEENIRVQISYLYKGEERKSNCRFYEGRVPEWVLE